MEAEINNMASSDTVVDVDKVYVFCKLLLNL